MTEPVGTAMSKVATRGPSVRISTRHVQSSGDTSRSSVAARVTEMDPLMRRATTGFGRTMVSPAATMNVGRGVNTTIPRPGRPRVVVQVPMTVPVP